MHYAEHGDGPTLVALHGAGVDHCDVESAIEAVVPTGYRRIYPDLPGMGHSASEGLTGNDDVVAVLADFIAQISDEPVMLLGHSYGGYLCRGLAAQRPELVRGLALICPVAEHPTRVPEAQVVVDDDDAYDELTPSQHAGFKEYFVVRTRATARRYRDHVAPGKALVDEASLARIFAGWAVDVGSRPLPLPTLIAAGRSDAIVGYGDATALLEHYPHASLTVIDDAGHALMHERPELLAVLLGDWLRRARRHNS